MNTPKAILIGFAMVAVAVYFSRDVGPAQAAIGSSNYSISSSPIDGKFFLLDNIKKTIKWCQGDINRRDMSDNFTCTPWQSIDKIKIYKD
jgi:hypothetical protein